MSCSAAIAAARLPPAFTSCGSVSRLMPPMNTIRSWSGIVSARVTASSPRGAPYRSFSGVGKTGPRNTHDAPAASAAPASSIEWELYPQGIPCPALRASSAISPSALPNWTPSALTSLASSTSWLTTKGTPDSPQAVRERVANSRVSSRESPRIRQSTASTPPLMHKRQDWSTSRGAEASWSWTSQSRLPVVQRGAGPSVLEAKR